MEEVLEFKCAGCGNKLFAKDAVDGLVECGSCFGKRVVPRKDNSPEALYFLHMGEHDLDTGAFDNAYIAYSKAAELSPKEPDAYWGMAIAKFKVQYITDTVEKIPRLQPICHEFTEKQFKQDKNYLKAIANATPAQKAEYERRAEEIDYIRSEFLNLKQSGLDYDCFICVKVSRISEEKTDYTKKNWTDDAYDADAIYDLLKRGGFTPFFSEREIRGRTGADYEAMILYALYTSETMIVVCHNEDYLLTPWVKNEYTRFKELVNNKEKENDSLTIVYNRAPIEKLPGSNGKIQGIDYSRREADMEIVKFVETHTPLARARREEEKRKKEAEAELLRQQIEEQKRAQRELEKRLNSINSGNVTVGGATANTLLKRASLELSQGYADKAAESCNKALDIDPENSDAWWFLFLLDFGVANEQELLNSLNVELLDKINANRNYKNAVKYAPEESDNRVNQFVKALHSPEQWWSLFLAEMKVTDEKYILSSINAAKCKKIDNSKNYANAVKYADENFKPRLQSFINKRYSPESCWKLFLEELGAANEESLLDAVNPQIYANIVSNKNFNIACKSVEGKVNELAFTDASGAKHTLKNIELDNAFKANVNKFCDWLYSGEFWWKKFLQEFKVSDEKELFNGITPNKRNQIEKDECFLNANKFASDEFKPRIKKFVDRLHSGELWWGRFLKEFKVSDENELFYGIFSETRNQIEQNECFLNANKFASDEFKPRIKKFTDRLYSGELWWERFLSNFNVSDEKELLNDITPDKRKEIESNTYYNDAKAFASEEFKVRIDEFEKQLETAEIWWGWLLREHKVKDENELLEKFDHGSYANTRGEINYIEARKYCGQELKRKLEVLGGKLDEKENYYNNARRKWDALLSEFGCRTSEDLKKHDKLIRNSENYKEALTLAEKSCDKTLIKFYKGTELANSRHVENLRANKLHWFLRRLMVFVIGVVPSLVAVIIGGTMFYDKMHVAMKVSMFLLLGIGIVYQAICFFLDGDNYGRQPIKAMLVQLLSFGLFIGSYVMFEIEENEGDFAVWCIYMLIPAALFVCYLTQAKAYDGDELQDNILLRSLPIVLLLAANAYLSMASDGSIPLWHVILQLILTIIAVGLMTGLYLAENAYWESWVVFGVFAVVSIGIVLFWLLWQIMLIILAILVVLAIIIGIIVHKIRN